jgi:hypothetical protein
MGGGGGGLTRLIFWTFENDDTSSLTFPLRPLNNGPFVSQKLILGAARAN